MSARIGYPAQRLVKDPQSAMWHLIAPAGQSCRLEADDGTAVIVLSQPSEPDLPLARGHLTADQPLLLERPEGGLIHLDRIEIDGQLCAYFATDALQMGLGYTEARPALRGARVASPEEISRLPSLGAGSLVMTRDGNTPIDWLRPGDSVITRDHGLQTLLWVGQHVMPKLAPNTVRPLRLAAGALGPDLPALDTTVTSGLGILTAGTELQLWFARSEMFAQAPYLCPACQTVSGRQTLYTMVFAQPEIVLANGLWVSSVTLDQPYLALIAEDSRAEVARYLPHHQQCAREWMQPWEAEMFLRDRMAKTRRAAA